MNRLSIACLVLSLTASFAAAANWPRFRGENGQGISLDKGVPVTFDGAKPLWQIDLSGPGNSSPIVWDGKIFVQSASADGSERKLVCISLAEGKELWSAEAPGTTVKTHNKNTLASGTAATDGQRVFVPFWNGTELSIVAYDLSGKYLWTYNAGKFQSQHGAGHSPMIVRDKVIIAADQDGRSSLIALNAATGKVAWETPRPPTRMCYSTPLLVPHPESDDSIVTVSTSGFGGYHPDDGRELWKWDWAGNNLRTVGSPIVGEGLVIVGSGNGAGSRHAVAVKCDGTGDVSQNGLAWEEKRTLPYVPTMLVWGEHLYYVNDRGVAGCHVIKTGDEVWSPPKRLGGDFSASPILVDGKIYAVNEGGEVFVLEASPKYNLLHRTSVADSVFATPAVSDGRLIIRGRTKLFCFGK